MPKSTTKVQWQQKKNMGSKGNSNNASSNGTTNDKKKGVGSMDSTTPVSNPFDVLNGDEEAGPNKQNSKDSVLVDPIDANLDVNGSHQESLWSQFQKATENEGLDDDEDEVYMPNDMHGGGFMDGFEDDLDCYDDFGAQIYDLTPQEQDFCDRFDIHLKSRGRK